MCHFDFLETSGERHGSSISCLTCQKPSDLFAGMIDRSNEAFECFDSQRSQPISHKDIKLCSFGTFCSFFRHWRGLNGRWTVRPPGGAPWKVSPPHTERWQSSPKHPKSTTEFQRGSRNNNKEKRKNATKIVLRPGSTYCLCHCVSHLFASLLEGAVHPKCTVVAKKNLVTKLLTVFCYLSVCVSV